MSKNEKQSLVTIVKMMSGKNGNCKMAWEDLCTLAGFSTPQPSPPFEKVVLEEQQRKNKSAIID